jgi:peptidoglycan/xylan/chitin deacetylase (PgdA/CDA1 family)
MKRFFFALCVIGLLGSCSKYTKSGSLPTAGLALTFDDYSVDNWYSYLDLLDSFHVKATFYISNYNRLNADQIQKLHEIEKRGHEIGYHTSNHPDLTKYYQQNGLQKLMKSEILDGLSLMNKDGFYPKTFAYPYGSHLPELDCAILKYFNSVRMLNSTSDYAQSLSASGGNQQLYAIVLDDVNGKSLNFIDAMIKNAKDGKDCFVVLVHEINNSKVSYSMSYDRLKHMLVSAQASGLHYYTASDLSKQ